MKILDHFGQCDALVADGRLVVHQRGAEDRFQRSHQAAVMLGDIGVDGIPPEPHPAEFLEIEEDGGRDQRIGALDRRQHGHAVAHDAEGGI